MSKNPAIQKILNFFSKLFWETTGDPYIPTRGRDERMVLDLLQYLPPEELEKLIAFYFTVETGIYSWPFFRCRLNELRQQMKKETQNPKPMMKDTYD